jgi:hypothetical protein
MVLREFQDGGRIKLDPVRSVDRLKENLLIDTTFDPLKSRQTVPLRYSVSVSTA